MSLSIKHSGQQSTAFLRPLLRTTIPTPTTHQGATCLPISTTNPVIHSANTKVFRTPAEAHARFAKWKQSVAFAPSHHPWFE